jgi:Tfp pilus assembly protein PilV
MRWKSKKGFVLLEVLLATAIAAFAICGILLMYITGMDLIRTSRNSSIATNYAQGIMEQVRNTPSKDIPDMVFEVEVNGVITKYYPVVVDVTLSRWSFSLPVGILPAAICTVYVDDIGSELFLVTIRVSWRQSNRATDSIVELVTQVTS